MIEGCRSVRQRSGRLIYEIVRIHRTPPILVDAEMQVRWGSTGVPRVPDYAEEVAPLHDGASLNDLTVQMRVIDPLGLLGVVDPDHVAANGRRSHARDTPVSSR